MKIPQEKLGAVDEIVRKKWFWEIPKPLYPKEIFITADK